MRTFYKRLWGERFRCTKAPFLGFVGCVYAYSKLQAYKSLSLCYRLNSALKRTETEPFSVCRFRPKLPAWIAGVCS